MNISLSSVPLLGLLLPGLLAFLTSCNERGEFVTRPVPIETPKENADTPSVATPEASEARVAIEDFKFEPEKLNVRPGTKVTWVNKDDEPHSATSSEKPKRFDSGVLDSEKSFSFTFTEPGSSAYFCKLHPHMTGLIVVQ